jgi:hypothetical protein
LADKTRIEEFWVAETSWFVNVSWVVNMEFDDFGVCLVNFKVWSIRMCGSGFDCLKVQD